MTDGNKDKSPQLGDGQLARVEPGATSDNPSLVPEIFEAIKQERIGQININVLLQGVTAGEKDPDRLIASTERMLELADRYEQNRLRAFRERADAIIAVKQRDPDEIEKRNNNRARRCLKYSVAGMSVASLGIAVVCVIMQAGVVITGLFASAGALGLAMLGPMATGESVSSTDIVRIVNAIRGASDDAEGGAEARRKKKGRNR